MERQARVPEKRASRRFPSTWTLIAISATGAILWLITHWTKKKLSLNSKL
jgi:hypothetical protein